MRVASYVWRREVPNIACGSMREASHRLIKCDAVHRKRWKKKERKACKKTMR
jgi:hypothetical protein